MPGIYGFLKQRLSWGNMGLPALLSYYRYISLLLTSFFYLVGPPAAPFHMKAGAVFCLLLEAFIFIRVYNENNAAWIKRLLIFIETVGLALILTITGGLDSPFIWYAVNPILLSATLLPAYYCWLMMTIFVTSALFLQRFSLYTPPDRALPMWPDRSSFFMIFILITLAAQIFSHMIARLTRQARVMEKQLQHIKALYDAIEVFSHHNTPHEAANLFASYGRKLTGAKKVIVWLEAGGGDKDAVRENFYIVRGPRDVLAEEDWYPYIKRIFEGRLDGPDTDLRRLPAGKDGVAGSLVTVRVKSSSAVHGILSAYYTDDGANQDGVRETLTFLADLCAGALERSYLESLADQFLLMEEKDRIAGEIHDNVTQNIFSLIYGLGGLAKREPLSEEAQGQVRLLQKTAQTSLKDLRASIYCLSSHKNKEGTFRDEVKQYLLDLGRLNHVAVDFSADGSIETLALSVKNALYRIVREASGNAIRHGNCDQIRVSVKALGRRLCLTVDDNGAGFDPKAIGHGAHGGLGLVNMRELARNAGGELVIESRPGKGTVVSCTVPIQALSDLTARKGGRREDSHC